MKTLCTKRALLLIVLAFIFTSSYAQSPVCEQNMSFELGNFTKWKYYEGTFKNTGVGGAGVLLDTMQVYPPSSQTLKRFTITSGTATDYYGGFPIKDPTRTYSLKLGFDTTNYCTNKARFLVHVPAGTDDYALIYRYAIVMQDPGHPANQQPRFLVKTTDSLTGTVLPGGDLTYVAGSLPGFLSSTVSGGTDVYYKSWATACLNLSGHAGRTIIVDFESVDCALGGHWGYGYFDMTCGLFKIRIDHCDIGMATSLTAPPGFASYQWTDSSFATTLSTSDTFIFVTPSTSKTYHVICTPYSGYGLPDTLTTSIVISDLAINASNDTAICSGSSTTLSVTKTGGMGSVTYLWSPSPTLSCSTCQSPVATPTVTTKYYVVVTDSSGCGRRDSVTVTVNTLLSAITGTLSVCIGQTTPLGNTITGGTWSSGATGVAAIGPSSGVVSAVSAGTATITYQLAASCLATAVVSVNPSPSGSASTLSDVHCNGGNNGSVSVTPSGGIAPYTYSWTTSPTQTTSIASGLPVGIYTVTVTDARGCTASSSASVTQPATLAATASTITNVACNGGNNGEVRVTLIGGTAPYAYSWNTSPVQTTTAVGGLAAGTYTVTVTDAHNCTITATAIVTESTTLAATASTLTDVACNGGNDGSVSATPSGGTSPYTYSWNTSPVQNTAVATGLPAGTYTVTVTDAHSCTRTASATVTEPTMLAASTSTITNVACNGGNNGEVRAIAIGGTAPYTYSWNTSPVQLTAAATGLAAGTYTVTVTDAHNCTTIATATVTESTNLAATASTLTDVSCNGGNNGSVSVTPTGGTTPYTYSWTTSPIQTTATATGLAAGTYTVTVTDAHSCTRTATATVTQPTLLAATANTLSNALCNGINNGSVKVTPSGGTTPYMYSWSTSPVQTTATASGLPAGTYTATVTDAHNCAVTAATTVTQPSTLAATASTLTNVACYGGNGGSAEVTVSGGTSPYTYSWNTSPTQTSATASGLAAGTYAVTVTDANNCSSTTATTVTQPIALAATASMLNFATCYGGNNGSAVVTPIGGTGPYTYSWSTTPAKITATASGLTAGTYTVTVTDAHNCVTTATATVTEPNALVATVSTLADVSCNSGNNGSVTVAPSGGTTPYAYSWNTSPTQTTATATGLPAGTYTATVTDAYNCIATATATVTEPTALAITASTLTNVACKGESNGSVTVAPSGGTSPYTYSWNTSPAQTTATATGLPAGTYAVTVRDAHNCTTTATTIVTQPETLGATIVTLTNVVCNGGNDGSVNVTPFGGTSPYIYSWLTTPAQTTATATGLVAGTYTVTVTDAHNCVTAAVATVTQPTLLTATANTISNALCNGINTGSVNVTPSGGTTPYTYSWTTSPVQTTATASGLPTGIYTVTVTDAHNCSVTATTTVTQPSTLAITTSTLTNVSCNGGNNGSVDVTPTGGTTPYTYSWNTAPTQTTATATGLPAGTYTVTVTDDHNCSVTASATVTEPTVLAATASTQANVSCNNGNNGSVTVVPEGGTLPYTFSWNTAPVQTTATAPGLTAGTYTVTVTDSNGCTTSSATTVTEPVTLTALATGDNILCNGGTTIINVAAAGGTTPYNGIGAYTVGAGIYSYMITDSNGCTALTSVTITQPDSLSLTSSSTDVGCNAVSNGSATIVAFGGTAPYTYQWDANTKDQLTPTATSLTKGAYDVTVTDQHGCAKTAIVIVNGQLSPLELTASATPAACYDGNSGSISVSTTGGTPPYTYTWSNGATGTNLSGLAAGQYSISVTDGAGCTTNATYTITQPTPVQVSLTPMVYPTGFNISTYNGSDGAVKTEANGGTAPYAYLWSNGNSGPELQNVPAGQYTVTITDNNGCIDTASVVLVEPAVLELPTGYSPNDDGKNDLFVVHGINAYPNNQLVVFNRWGNEVYSADGYNNTWNGRNKDGKDLPAGTYFVVLTINGGAITRNGYVDLRR